MIKLVNLTKIYHTEDEGSLALRGISVEFPEKGFVAITGESGSGKTTLLNILSGFISFEEGDFFIDGVDFMTLTPDEMENYLKNDIGFVFQDYHLIENHTALDNLIEALLIVGVHPHEAKKKSLECLKKFGLFDQRNLKARSLSSGQKQKLAIARAIIKEPKIVLCDEPTANLDGDSGMLIFEILKEYSKDHLVIVSTHNYEDAEPFATHFMRLYKGNLTTYKQIREIDDKPVQTANKKKTDYFNLSLKSFKSQVPQNVVKTVFYSIIVASLLFLLALFNSNVDDNFTKIVTRDVFNNVAPEQMLVMHKDKTIINEEQLSECRDLDHVVGTQLYGLASEMNYYYREDVDYTNTVIVYKEQIGNGAFVEKSKIVFETLREDMYIKSYQGMINESDLESGHLPNAFNEIVAYGDYQIDEEITIYFHDPILQGAAYIELPFKVVGKLNKATEDVYFSPLFMKNIDYIQYYSYSSSLGMTLNFYYLYTDPYTVGEKQGYRSNAFAPIYNPSLADNEIRFSETSIKAFRSLFSSKEKILASYAFFANTGNNRLDVDMNVDEPCHELAPYHVYVGKDIFNFFIESYVSYYSRIIIDNYSYIDNVIYQLTNKSFDCLSEYRAASTKYDEDKQNQRAITLITSMSLVVIEVAIYFIFSTLLEKSRLSADHTLYLIGSSSSSLRKSSLIQISAINVLSIAIGFALYGVISLCKIPFVDAANLYLRFYHFLIVIALVVIANFSTYWKYVRSLENKGKRGGKN